MTLLPACLGLAGRRHRPLVDPAPQRTRRQAHLGFAGAGHTTSATARGATRSSVWSLLIAFAAPIVKLKMGFADDSNTAATQHRAQGLRTAQRHVRRRLQRPVRRWSSTSRTTTDDSVLTDLAAAVAADPGIAAVQPPLVNAAGDTACHRGSTHHSPQDAATDDDAESTARRRWCRLPSTDRAPTSWSAVARPCSSDLSDRITEPPAAVHPGRRDAVVPPADDRVPIGARPAQGGDHEPAVDRRRLRRDRRRVPVGLGQRARRTRRDRTRQPVRSDDHVRDPVRSVDGLRGLPPVAGP